MIDQFIFNYDKSFKLGPCYLCGGKPRLINTHVACSNPRCDNYSNSFRDTSWNRSFLAEGMTERARQTWIEPDNIERPKSGIKPSLIGKRMRKNKV